MKKSKVPAAVPYSPKLLKELQDPEYAAAYLSACIDDDSSGDMEVFFEALHNIMKARGMTAVSKRIKSSRDALYKTLKQHHNPKLRSFRDILQSVGMDIAIVPIHKD